MKEIDMKHTYNININDDILKGDFADIVDLAVLKKANDKIIADPEFKIRLDFLEDLRKAEIAIGFDEMLKRIELV